MLRIKKYTISLLLDRSNEGWTVQRRSNKTPQLQIDIEWSELSEWI